MGNVKFVIRNFTIQIDNAFLLYAKVFASAVRRSVDFAIRDTFLLYVDVAMCWL